MNVHTVSGLGINNRDSRHTTKSILPTQEVPANKSPTGGKATPEAADQSSTEKHSMGLSRGETKNLVWGYMGKNRSRRVIQIPSPQYRHRLRKLLKQNDRGKHWWLRGLRPLLKASKWMREHMPLS